MLSKKDKCYQSRRPSDGHLNYNGIVNVDKISLPTLTIIPLDRYYNPLLVIMNNQPIVFQEYRQFNQFQMIIRGIVLIYLVSFGQLSIHFTNNPLICLAINYPSTVYIGLTSGHF